MRSFLLTDQPWIPVRTIDGDLRRVGLTAALTQAHLYADLACDNPSVATAVHRLLLAVLHKGLRGPDEATWAAAWRDKQLPAKPITTYLDDHGHGFDLWCPQRPFAQHPELDTREVGVDRLTAHPERGAGPGWFTPIPRELSEADAALWLLWCHAYDTGGIRARHGGGKEMGVPTGPLGYSGQLRLCGPTLAQTLLLSLPNSPTAPRDLGWWERVDPPTRRRSHEPAGPVHNLTWAARRILLNRDADGMVRRVRIAAGDDLRKAPDPHGSPRSLVGEDSPTELIARRLRDALAPNDQPPPAPVGALAQRVTAGLVDGATLVRVAVTTVVYDTYGSMVHDEGTMTAHLPAAAVVPGTVLRQHLETLLDELVTAEAAVARAAVAALNARCRTVDRQRTARATADAVCALRHATASAAQRALSELHDTDELTRCRHTVQQAAANLVKEFRNDMLMARMR